MAADKIERVLGIYSKLINGGTVYKAEEAANYDVDERSIARDIKDIRDFLDVKSSEDGVINTIVFNRSRGGYRLEEIFKQKFSNPEILAICKILLESRAFTKKEMTQMLDKLVESSVPKENQELVSKLIKNEEFHYIEPHHQTIFMDNMWEIGKAINNHQYIEFHYKGIKGKKGHTRIVKPVAIMFSDYYFYLAAFINDDEVKKNFDIINDFNPTIYRIDRINNLKVLEQTFRSPYADRFEEGEFKKRVQFMYPGKLRRVKFEYRGYSLEAILDRLPTAEIRSERFDSTLGRNIYEVYAEVYGDGIDRWIQSQRDDIKIIN